MNKYTHLHSCDKVIHMLCTINLLFDATMIYRWYIVVNTFSAKRSYKTLLLDFMESLHLMMLTENGI